MPSSILAMVVTSFFVTVVNGRSLHADHSSVGLSDELLQLGFGPAKKLHLGMAIDLGLMRRRKMSGPPRVYCLTHSACSSHKGGLGFQVMMSSLCVGRDISREIALLENAKIMMLQDEITLRFADVTFCTYQP